MIEKEPGHAINKMGEKKAPVRMVMCPKCFSLGATMDLRNSNKQVMSADLVVDAYGNAQKRLKTLEHTIKCRDCGETTRKVR